MSDPLGRRRDTLRFKNVDLPAQRILEVKDETAEIEDCAAGFKLDQKIDVAVGTCLSACYGAKHTNVAGSVPCGDGEKLLSAEA